MLILIILRAKRTFCLNITTLIFFKCISCEPANGCMPVSSVEQ